MNHPLLCLLVNGPIDGPVFRRGIAMTPGIYADGFRLFTVYALKPDGDTVALVFAHQKDRDPFRVLRLKDLRAPESPINPGFSDSGANEPKGLAPTMDPQNETSTPASRFWDPGDNVRVVTQETIARVLSSGGEVVAQKTIDQVLSAVAVAISAATDHVQAESDHLRSPHPNGGVVASPPGGPKGPWCPSAPRTCFRKRHKRSFVTRKR